MNLCFRDVTELQNNCTVESLEQIKVCVVTAEQYNSQLEDVFTVCALKVTKIIKI